MLLLVLLLVALVLLRHCGPACAATSQIKNEKTYFGASLPKKEAEVSYILR